MDFRLLGPLRVNDGHQDRLISAARQRSVLAALLLHANRVMSSDALSADIWDGDPPPRARATLASYVMRLRQTLGPVASRRLHTREPGYLLEVHAGELDIARFRAHSERGHQLAAEGQWTRAAAEFRAGLDLWSDQPLVNITSDAVAMYAREQLNEQWLITVERCIEADLNLGRHDRAAVELADLVRRHPLRERLHHDLVVALYRSGRRADAVAAYRAAHKVLVDELGVNPGLELQTLFRRILNDDPSLLDVTPEPIEIRPAAGVAGRPRVPVPAQLPMAPEGFVARRAELATLRRLLVDGRTAEASVVTVTGMGGIGKTALAMAAGHLFADEFPDGQLFAELQPGGVPADPDQVIGHFLRSLGFASADVPSRGDDLLGLYRSALASLRMLVVLDDVHDVAQLARLLPGSSACRVIATGRRAVFTPSSHMIRLTPLTDADARTLLASIVGEFRLRAEPEAVEMLLHQCGGYPLAIRAVAGRLLARPSWTIAATTERLASRATRLDELRAYGMDVGAGLSTSYQLLDGIGATLAVKPVDVLRELARLDADRYDVAGVSELVHATVDNARTALEALVDVHLLTSPAPDNYQMDGLVRLLASGTS
jgi:DNA-binding SARP family transcriptional activator